MQEIHLPAGRAGVVDRLPGELPREDRRMVLDPRRVDVFLDRLEAPPGQRIAPS